MAKRKPLKSAPRLKRLIRFLNEGDKLEVIGKRGKKVKRFIPGREYVVRVKRKGKLVGYVNNIKNKKPVAKEFSRSMVARLKHSRVASGFSVHTSQSKTRLRISSSRRLKSQISKKALREIRANKGKAFSLRIEYGRERAVTQPVYVGDYVGDEELENMIVSNFLFTMGQRHHRISPILRDNSQLTLEQVKDSVPVGRLKGLYAEVFGEVVSGDLSHEQKNALYERLRSVKPSRANRRFIPEATLSFEFNEYKKERKNVRRRSNKTSTRTNSKARRRARWKKA